MAPPEGPSVGVVDRAQGENIGGGWYARIHERRFARIIKRGLKPASMRKGVAEGFGGSVFIEMWVDV